jgi:hypothetical protein
LGDKQAVSMNMKIGMDMSAGGNQIPAMDLPAIQMNMDVTVQDVSTDGEITYGVVFSGATVTAGTNTLPTMAAAMKTGLAEINGLTGTGKMSDHGIVKSLELKMPAAADPLLSQNLGQMKDSFSSSTMPLPEEAVGPGAKWEYKTRLKSQGMAIDQTIDCELVSIDGDHLTLRNTVTQNATNQKIQSPAMPGMKVDLVKMTGTGAGDTTLDLGKVIPVAASLDEKTEILMGMNIGQQKQTMDMKMNLNVTLESK